MFVPYSLSLIARNEMYFDRPRTHLFYADGQMAQENPRLVWVFRPTLVDLFNRNSVLKR